MPEILIGSHVSMSKPDYLLGSAQTALSYGANVFMIYTGAPQNSIRTPLGELKIEQFQKYLHEHNIDLRNVIVHAPYVMNLGSGDPKKHAISLQTLKNEVHRTCTIGAKYLVVHPGNAIEIPREQAIINIAKAINAINKINKNVVICLETMSGKGTEIGKTFEELANIIKLIDNKSFIGICLDTCHINDAGYSDKDIEKTLMDFERIIGLKYLKVIHLNDSKNPQGSSKDRHENIGYGTIGFETLLKWVHDPRLISIPKILETPYWKDKPLYKEEIQVLRNKKWINFRV
ncbi:MAG: deoxyribonuclease IV [Mycoplasmataceae bacterium]|nr:deoxyribonuclease IV [Mycoplasmataceae bacterium]